MRRAWPALLGVLAPGGAHACAVCVGWADEPAVNVGFYWSALLLTALPFAVAVAIGAWMRAAARRQPSDGASGQRVSADVGER